MRKRSLNLFKKTCLDRLTLGTLNLLLINKAAYLILIYSGVFCTKRRHMYISTTGCQLFHKLISLRNDAPDQRAKDMKTKARAFCKNKISALEYTGSWTVSWAFIYSTLNYWNVQNKYPIKINIIIIFTSFFLIHFCSNYFLPCPDTSFLFCSFPASVSWTWKLSLIHDPLFSIKNIHGLHS